MKTIYRAALVTFLLSSTVFSQITVSGVPFLTISPSGEANGMGGVSGIALSPSSIYFNPANLGILSQTVQAGAEFYLQKNNGGNIRGLDIGTTNMYDYYHHSFIAGFSFSEESRARWSLGFSYSRTIFDYGATTLQRSSDPGDARSFDVTETSDNFTIGASYSSGILVASGITFKQITSPLTALSYGRFTLHTAKPVAIDAGINSKFPLMDLLSCIVEPSDLFLSFADVGIFYAVNNWGEEVQYIGTRQSDPLPRMARLGWTFEAGYNITEGNTTLNIVSIALCRESESSLFDRHRDSIGRHYYLSSPLGKIKPYRNLIEGTTDGSVLVRRGLSLNFFETVFIRSGSNQFWTWNLYTTEGIAFSTKGFFKLIDMEQKRSINSKILSFILNSIEIRYNNSEYSFSEVIGRSEFENISLVLHY